MLLAFFMVVQYLWSTQIVPGRTLNNRWSRTMTMVGDILCNDESSRLGLVQGDCSTHVAVVYRSCGRSRNATCAEHRAWVALTRA